jgi:glycosyltransferase involved in cell wall biosynthesis
MQAFPGSPVVLVDSDSSDSTVAVASRYPVSIYRYRYKGRTAAAGRRIGFNFLNTRYVLFVDGDCCIDPDWVVQSIPVMESTPDAAVIYGARKEIYEGIPTNRTVLDPAVKVHTLGGNALYRAKVLRDVDGFNPFLVSEEEGELLGRIVAAGYREIRTAGVMITHHTVSPDSLQGVLRRQRLGLCHGRGQVLRLSITQGMFAYHARRFNRYLFLIAYFLLGAILGIVGLLLKEPIIPLAWVCLGLAAFGWLWFRRGSLSSAINIFIDWLLGAHTISMDILARPPRIETFKPIVERIQ